MSALGGLQDRAELMRRLAFTAVVLIIYRFGTLIPLPGIDPLGLSQFDSTVVGRISILALGITPLVTVLILAELVKILAPRCQRWEHADPRNHDKLNRIVLLLALLAAAAQALGLAVALEGVAGLVSTPGSSFKLVCAATLVAGTALVIWLADQVTRHGLGSGVWLLFVAPILVDLPHQLAGLMVLQRQGALSGMELLVCGLLVVLAIATVVAVVRAGGSTLEVAATCLWAVLLASTALPWLLVAVGMLVRGVGWSPTLPWFGPGHLVHVLVLAGLIGGFVHLYRRSQRSAGEVAPLVVAPAVIGGALIAAVLVGEALPSALDLRVPLTSVALIIVTVVAMIILTRWWTPPFEAASPDEAVSPRA
jgi:preprotein translocase subunit SecY